jgi:hypothetical protein
LLTLLFFLLLALLVPVALYCVALALVNRRPSPLMVRGVWDTVGLLFASSGLLLIVFPRIIGILHQKAMDDAPEAMAAIWAGYSGLTIIYFVVLALGIALALWLRRDKTVIYNVDPDKFEMVLAQTLSRLGLTAVRSGRQIRIGGGNRPPTAQEAPPDAFEAAQGGLLGHGLTPYPRAASSVEEEPGFFAALLEVDPFAPLANVTLHWRHWDDSRRSGLRREIEDELARNLDAAARDDNPAVTWLLGIATAIFGLLFLAILLLILLTPRHGG